MKNKLIPKIKDRLHNNISPDWSYDYPFKIAYSAIIKNKPYYDNYNINLVENDNRSLGLYEEYLNIPSDKRKSLYKLEDSIYKPSNSKDINSNYKKLSDLSEEDKKSLIKLGMLLSPGSNGLYQDLNSRLIDDPTYSIPNTSGLGNFTISRGIDENGDEYISYYDKYDLNPFAGGNNNRSTKLSKILGLNKKGDLSFGLGHPFEIYDRLYLKDFDLNKLNSSDEESKFSLDNYINNLKELGYNDNQISLELKLLELIKKLLNSLLSYKQGNKLIPKGLTGLETPEWAKSALEYPVKKSVKPESKWKKAMNMAIRVPATMPNPSSIATWKYDPNNTIETTPKLELDYLAGTAGIVAPYLASAYFLGTGVGDMVENGVNVGNSIQVGLSTLPFAPYAAKYIPAVADRGLSALGNKNATYRVIGREIEKGANNIRYFEPTNTSTVISSTPQDFKTTLSLKTGSTIIRKPISDTKIGDVYSDGYSYIDLNGKEIAHIAGNRRGNNVFVESSYIDPSLRHQGLSKELYNEFNNEVYNKLRTTLHSSPYLHMATVETSPGSGVFISPSSKLWQGLKRDGLATIEGTGLDKYYVMSKPINSNLLPKNDTYFFPTSQSKLTEGEIKGIPKGERFEPNYGNIKFIRVIDGLPEILSDGFVRLSPLDNELTNFSTDIPFRTHSDYSLYPGTTIITVEPKSLKGFRPLSIEPSDTFFPNFQNETELKFNPNDITIISGDDNILKEAFSKGFKIDTRDYIKKAFNESVLKKGKLDKLDKDNNYFKSIVLYFDEIGRPTLRDYKNLEQVTGLKAGVRGDIKKQIEEYTKKLETFKNLPIQKLYDERNSWQFLYPKTSYPGDNNLQGIIDGRRMIDMMNESMPFDFKNVFYDPYSHIETALMQSVGGHGHPKINTGYRNILQRMLDDLKSYPIKKKGGKLIPKQNKK